MKIKVVKSDAMDDWYVIERAEHDNRHWMEPIDGGMALRYSGRFSDADIEGTHEEMIGIAEAIESESDYDAKRCSVRFCEPGEPGEVAFNSPRNSMEDGFVSLAEAADLVKPIRALTPLSR